MLIFFATRGPLHVNIELFCCFRNIFKLFLNANLTGTCTVDVNPFEPSKRLTVTPDLDEKSVMMLGQIFAGKPTTHYQALRIANGSISEAAQELL